ncbi:MAG: glycosyltransferase [Chloroflexota bacterium]|nr:MAG: glycosyltransferase [Chloroflexota bacterium]
MTSRPRSLAILGVRVDDVTYGEALEFSRRFIRSGKPHLLVTVNTEFVVSAQKDARFRDVINTAALSVPDGGGLLLAGRIFGFPLREQVRGTDLADRLAELCALEGHRLFLLGAAEGVAAEAGRRLSTKYPGLQVAGTYGGSPDPGRDAEMVARVRQAGRVDVLLVAYGAPAQELWIARNLERLGTPVAMGVGGVFDYFSGRVPRAPKWMRDLGLEWLYRLVRQPWRWRRQLALPRFALTVLWSVLRRRQAIVSLRGDPLVCGGEGD